MFTSWPLERLVGLGILSVALMFTLGLAFLAHLGHRTLTWPTTSGVVIDSHLSRSRSDGKDRYSAQVTYTYSVGGQTYRSDRVTHRSSQPDEAFARHTLARYPQGRPVRVSYDPAAPQRAVLEPGTDGFVLGALAAAAVALVVGGGVVVSTFRPVSTWVERHRSRRVRPQGRARRARGGVRSS